MDTVKKKRGRPRAIGDKEIDKIEQGFLLGLNVRETLLYANVKSSTFYSYLDKHKDFAERVDILKNNVKMQAKINIAGSIESGNVDLSKWYLENRASDEFSKKNKNEEKSDLNLKIEIPSEVKQWAK